LGFKERGEEEGEGRIGAPKGLYSLTGARR
jgi:hypothetical protein